MSPEDVCPQQSGLFWLRSRLEKFRLRSNNSSTVPVAVPAAVPAAVLAAVLAAGQNEQSECGEVDWAIWGSLSRS